MAAKPDLGWLYSIVYAVALERIHFSRKVGFHKDPVREGRRTKRQSIPPLNAAYSL
ncbi:hypothetical protein IC582_008545 [Cucumis melo]